ncbi:MAG: SpoIIIAH-like family protein [Clostridia bacterium]|nr:SpoIIIAH-like family protein [Clostridia bacterium]
MHGRDSNEINLGDVELVNSEPIEVEEVESGNIVPNEGLIENTIVLEERKENTNLIEDSFNDKHDYFEETRIERERMYSEMLETYEKLMKNVDIPNDQKAIAVQEISNITNIKNGIMISENLIKNKGFEDAIILVNNNTASVVVKSYTLSQEQISKIQNIIQRELPIEAKNINISNKF